MWIVQYTNPKMIKFLNWMIWRKKRFPQCSLLSREARVPLPNVYYALEQRVCSKSGCGQTFRADVSHRNYITKYYHYINMERPHFCFFADVGTISYLFFSELFLKTYNRIFPDIGHKGKIYNNTNTNNK